jgi:hypothetical protein
MYYQILSSPPGFNEKYLLVAYKTLDHASIVHGSTRHAVTLDEAHGMLPPGAKRLDFTPHGQFLELWEAAD